MSFLCPNCCLNLFRSSSKNKQALDGFAQPQHAELIEDQTIININKKSITPIPHQYFPQNNLMDQINVQLNLDNHKNARKGSKQERNKQTKNVKEQDLIGNSNQQQKYTNQNQYNQQNELQQQNNTNQNTDEYIPTQQQLIPNYSKFSINIDPYDKNYQTLHSKTLSLDKYFILSPTPQLLLDLNPHKTHLKIYKISPQNNKFNIKLQLPCSYSYYTQLMKDSNLNNKKYMMLFERSQVLQAFKPNFTKNLIRLKRFNVLQPREFIYYKYSNGSFKQNWQICFSQSSQQSTLKQNSSNSANFQTKLCQILSISNFKQINQHLYINQYLQVELKLNNLNNYIWVKILNEVKQYYQNIYHYIQKNYQKQLL